MADEFDILIGEAGDVSFVYSDDLAEVFAGEPQTTTRASHVEPWSYGALTGWTADMRPSGGPVLFLNCEQPDTQWNPQTAIPFTTRQQALDAERAWLREHKDL